MSKKVYVGLSGGVDSSVSAALLVRQGYDVVGIYMKNWSQDLPGMKCPWAEDLADAKRVATRLGIDFKVFDFENEYKHRVVDYMVHEYEAGRTPNPDIMCNQEVKFKLFLEAALEDGADMIATGHYAQINEKISKKKNFELLKAKDRDKDQTYFLYRINEQALAKTLFPIGHLLKSEVRELARGLNLQTATKKDSQGICFVGSVGIRDFISEFVETKLGEIIEKETGRMLGLHDGAIFYTFGQRHGLDVGGGLPYYVVGKDMARNKVYVSTNLNNDSFWQKEIKLSHLHWINNIPQPDEIYQVRVRHRAALIDATFDGETVGLAAPERAVAPGQSVVFYNDEVCLGGGIVV